MTETVGGARVEVAEHLWIPLPDGVRLAARLWLPQDPRPVPAIFEYIPYRKTDMVRARDERNHPYFARHGYACLRIDMRGSGDSEGRMEDMYGDHELADAHHIIRWIASQSWCSGSVGMFGTSWGGTASLQANMDAPEALKAVIAVCATHDRYEDDIHHMGGCLLTDTFEWGATLPAILGAPPTTNVGPDWKERWIDRLETAAFPVEAWVREEARGTYWRHGSVIHETERLSRPILAVGGWSDRYSNSVMTLVDARPDLVWGVVGPWGHHYPDQGHPGPAVGFQQLALEWWDHWLKPSSVTAPPEWPRLRVWLREFDPPQDAIDRRNGAWMESGPTYDHTDQTRLFLTPEGLSGSDAGEFGWEMPTDLKVGEAGGDTGYFGRYGGLPLDQRKDDARSLCFETPPLEQDLILYGAASVQLTLSVPGTSRQISLRLNEVAEDGTSVRVGLCVRNLALDEGLDVPERPPTGAERRVTVPFHTTAYRFSKGRRIRLAVSGGHWPTIWPSPSMGGVRITAGHLDLPTFNGTPRSLGKALPEALDLPKEKPYRSLSAPRLERFFSEQSDGQVLSGWHQPFSEVFYDETQSSFGYETRAEHRIDPTDPLSAQSRFEHRAVYRRPDGTAVIYSEMTAHCDTNSHHLSGRLTATWENETLIDRDWAASPTRRHG